MTGNPFLLSEEVRQIFPDLFYTVVEIKGVRIAPTHPGLERDKVEIVSAHTPTVEALGMMSQILAYRQIFKQTHVWGEGRRPSPEALLRRLAQGKGLYTVNTAVDAYNLAVIETGIGLGGFDADQVKLPVTLRLTEAGEPMQLLGDNGKVTETKAGEVAYADADKLLTLDLNYRDIDAAKLTAETVNILLFADGGPGLKVAEVVTALQKGADYIQKYCGGNIGEIQIVQ